MYWILTLKLNNVYIISRKGELHAALHESKDNNQGLSKLQQYRYIVL